MATGLGFGVVPASPADRLRQYAGRLVIPSIGPRDNVYDVAFRCIEHEDCKTTVLWTDDKGKEHYCPKYLFLDGVDKRLYNLQALNTPGDTIDIVEGQLDAATLHACGLAAVGVPGANGWKSHHHRLFQGFNRIRVWGDGDVAGKDFARKVAAELASAEVMMVEWGSDVNDTYVKGGRDAILRIAEGSEEDHHDDTSGWGLEQDDEPWPHDSERPPF